MMREKVTQVQESQSIPKKINPKTPTVRHIIIKMAILKTRYLKDNKRK